jgi:hypothetical protein
MNRNICLLILLNPFGRPVKNAVSGYPIEKIIREDDSSDFFCK